MDHEIVARHTDTTQSSLVTKENILSKSALPWKMARMGHILITPNAA